MESSNTIYLKYVTFDQFKTSMLNNSNDFFQKGKQQQQQLGLELLKNCVYIHFTY